MVNVPSSPVEPGVRLADPVAEDQAVLGQLVGDGQHGGPDPFIFGRQESHDGDEEEGRIQSSSLP